MKNLDMSPFMRVSLFAFGIVTFSWCHALDLIYDCGIIRSYLIIFGTSSNLINFYCQCVGAYNPFNDCQTRWDIFLD